MIWPLPYEAPSPKPKKPASGVVGEKPSEPAPIVAPVIVPSPVSSEPPATQPDTSLETPPAETPPAA
jgi:hypothetical protein